MAKVEVLYRYDLEQDLGWEREFGKTPLSFAKLILTRYYVVKETTYGYWITKWSPRPTAMIHLPMRNNYKWVSKTGKKRLCYPTEVEALESCRARTKRRLEYLDRDLKIANDGITLLNKALNDNGKN
jgi:hypothetical protein